MANRPVITLLTDFGLTDEYVGVVKGVLLTYCPGAQLVDISHNIPPQNIQTASHLLHRSFRYFPQNSVHLVIVDPGVGSKRQILAIHAENHFFVGPDNGLFSRILSPTESTKVYRVTSAKHCQPKISKTFHGRDIMAPAAGWLASSGKIDELGPEVGIKDCIIDKLWHKNVFDKTDNTLTGTICHIDRFGNLCTTFQKDEIVKRGARKKLTIQIDSASIVGINSSYSEVENEALVAYFDSHNFLEIGARNSNAAKLLQAKVGDQIRILIS